MDRSYYGAIERGECNVRVDTVIKIAAALEMTAAELFGRAKL
jgi:transcriptional regulator with XRE-family HTH domain